MSRAGAERGVHPPNGAGMAEVWCTEEEEDGRKDGRMEGRMEGDGVAQVTLLPAAVGARMG